MGREGAGCPGTLLTTLKSCFFCGGREGFSGLFDVESSPLLVLLKVLVPIFYFSLFYFYFLCFFLQISAPPAIAIFVAKHQLSEGVY